MTLWIPRRDRLLPGFFNHVSRKDIGPEILADIVHFELDINAGDLIIISGIVVYISR